MIKARLYRKLPPTIFGTYSNSTGSTILLPLCLHKSVDLCGVCVCPLMFTVGIYYFYGKIKTEAQPKLSNKILMKRN